MAAPRTATRIPFGGTGAIATGKPFPLGEKVPEGRMRGPSLARREVPPHQFGQMTYGRAIEAEFAVCVGARARKSWPHVLSPEGRGDHRVQRKAGCFRSRSRRLGRASAMSQRNLDLRAQEALGRRFA